MKKRFFILKSVILKHETSAVSRRILQNDGVGSGPGGNSPVSHLWGFLLLLKLESVSCRIIPIRWELLENHYDFSILAALVSITEHHKTQLAAWEYFPVRNNIVLISVCA